MQARDLVELASLAAQHGHLVMNDAAPLPAPCLERYWSGSKCRLDRWGRMLKRLTEIPVEGHTIEELRASIGMLEEIVTGDVLARVWGGVITAHDRQTGEDAGSVARTVLLGQHEAQNRAMSMLVNSPLIDAATAQRLDRLRRRAECWSDLLVGFISMTHDVCEFGSNAERARDFADDFRDEGPQAWSLMFASLRASFATAFDRPSPNADLNGEIAAGIVLCFQPEIFDSTGLLRPLWISRLQHATNETQCMIDALFSDDYEQHETAVAEGTIDREFVRRRFLP
ncbi:MAG TPA: hypothetical protein VHD36_24000 [Pirellulales bacterium]|nr:hypothetical protein [Pirellulales bacterium]